MLFKTKFVFLVWFLSAGLTHAQVDEEKFGGNYSLFETLKAFQPLTTSATILRKALNDLNASSLEIASAIRQDGPPPQSMCPAGLTVSSTFPHFKLLNELPSADCQLYTGMGPSLGTLENKSSVFSGFFEALVGPNLKNYGSDFWSTGIDGALLRCKHDPGLPFATISFIPLVEVVLIHVHTIFRAHGLNQNVFDEVFSQNVSSSSNYTDMLDYAFMNESRREIASVLKNLTNANLMSLHRTDEGQAKNLGGQSIPGVVPEQVRLSGILASIFSSDNPPCMFAGGPNVEPQAIHVQLLNLERVLLPVFAHFLAAKPVIRGLKMFPVDPLCNSSSGIFTGLNTLEFPDTENLHVNGARCGSMKLQSFLEAEPRLRNGSLDMRLTQGVTDKIAQVRARLDTKLSTMINQSRFVNKLPGLSTVLQKAIIKSSITVARLNFAACQGLPPSLPMAAWVIFPRARTSSLVCQNFPLLPPGIGYNCPSNGTAGYSNSNTMYGVSAFLVHRDDNLSNSNSSVPSVCLFSSNETMAKALRAAVSSKRLALSNNSNITIASAPNSPTPSVSVLASQAIPLPPGVVAVSPSSSVSPSPSASVTPRELIGGFRTANSTDVGVNPRSSNNTGPACFPARAKVLLRDGRSVRMDRLKIGDEAHIGGGKFSAIILFTHANPYVTSLMVALGGNGWKLVLSINHLLPVNGVLTPAIYVKPGDRVQVGTTEEIVQRVGHATSDGLYNPQTASGTLMVSLGTGKPVLVSTYTTEVAHAAAHALLAPLRAIYFATGWTFNSISEFFPGAYNVSKYEKLSEAVRSSVIYSLMREATITFQ